jgi:rhodanese-related sulfurtransferase
MDAKSTVQAGYNARPFVWPPRMERLLEYISLHPVLAGLAVVLVIAVVVYEVRASRQAQSALRPQEAIQLMNEGAHVYDLRDGAAWTAGRISGAKHLDASQHDGAADTLKRFKDKLLLLYCENGNVSAGLMNKLQASGFTKVFTLRGGLAQWRAEGLPLQNK